MCPGICNGEAMNFCPYVTGAIGFACGVLSTAILCKIKRNAGAASRGDARGKVAARRGARPPAKIHPAPPPGSIEIYVGNLSYDMTEDELRKEFEAFGKVDDARIITNRFNGHSKGFGFVHMPNREEVAAAVAALDNKEIRGRRMRCNEAKSEERNA